MGSSDWQKGPDTGVFGMRYSGGGRGLPDPLFCKNLQVERIEQGVVGGRTGLIPGFIWRFS